MFYYEVYVVIKQKYFIVFGWAVTLISKGVIANPRRKVSTYLHAGCCKKRGKGMEGEIVELYICADFVKDNNEASVVVNVDSSNHPGDLLKSNPDSNRWSQGCGGSFWSSSLSGHV